MSDLLKEICEYRQQDVANMKHQPLADRVVSTPRGFVKAIQQRIPNTALICEIKKSSPSAGLIRPDFNPSQHAKDYEKAGAVCLSVLTEPRYFEGSAEYLQQARAACNLPVLRKDFMVDPWQVEESYKMGADCILIIIAALSFDKSKEILEQSTNFGMDCLIEIHTQQELETALKLPLNSQHHLLGINNRNLKTLEISLENSFSLVKQAQASGCIVVSESGIKTSQDINILKQADIHSFLVGESLLKQQDLVKAVRKLL